MALYDSLMSSDSHQFGQAIRRILERRYRAASSSFLPVRDGSGTDEGGHSHPTAGERALEFIRSEGPYSDGIVFGTLAGVIQDRTQAEACIAEGLQTLDDRAPAHNHLWFHRHVMYAAVSWKDWKRVHEHADHLQAYAEPRDIPWADFMWSGVGRWPMSAMELVWMSIEAALWRLTRNHNVRSAGSICVGFRLHRFDIITICDTMKSYIQPETKRSRQSGRLGG